MDSPSYTVAFSRAARRRLAKLPESAVAALIEHLMGPVASNPHQLGKLLEKPLNGVWSTRRGEYRALYIINDTEHLVTVIAVDHRRDVYRPR
ncbi:type II toxin-antitoxin system RelE/ParE family toxin [Lentzea sp. NPDC051838]|uniref:type II toxin-antitoxin system RelE family toxin n=1 Tax=Lentzea sp. NPDC051838 TaxID=3154849 RepID=UPI0034322947